MLGVLLVDKPLGFSSHDVVNVVRRKLGVKRVGHAGTLDPLATGLLVMAVGPATRFLQYLPLEPKEYIATARFGEVTDTQDAEGEVVSRLEVPADLLGAIEQAVPGFLGRLDQLPPMHSAVKKNGKPLYAYARKGVEVERTARTVFIEAYDVLDVATPEARFRVVCSGGTYVRTLIHELGQAMGCGAHLVGLQRTRVGRFELADAKALDGVTADALIPLREALPPLPLVELDAAQTAMARDGRAVSLSGLGEAPAVGLIGDEGDVIGVARCEAGALVPVCVIPREVADGALRT